jgi:hypothetical protein
MRRRNAALGEHAVDKRVKVGARQHLHEDAQAAVGLALVARQILLAHAAAS